MRVPGGSRCARRLEAAAESGKYGRSAEKQEDLVSLVGK